MFFSLGEKPKLKASFSIWFLFLNIFAISTVSEKGLLYLTLFCGIFSLILIPPNLKLLIKTLLILIPFTIFIFISLLLTYPGPYVGLFDYKFISILGLKKALFIGWKLILIGFVLSGVMSNYRSNEIIYGVNSLPFPSEFSFVIFLIYRYSLLLINEAEKILWSIKARGDEKVIKIAGNALGSLFLRAIYRGERLKYALLASNYREDINYRFKLKLSKREIGLLIVIGVLEGIIILKSYL